MKYFKKIASILCCVALLGCILTESITASAASAKTKTFLEPFDRTSYQKVDGHWTFTKAYKYNIKLPEKYDVDLKHIDSYAENGGVFGYVNDVYAIAAFKTKRTMQIFDEIYGKGKYFRKENLFKNFVACESEIIYHFENGFKEFEFMGIAGSPTGTGTWAGAFGMEEAPPLEISYSSDGNKWNTMKYKDMRVLPNGEASTSAYFCNTSRNTNKNKPKIPKDARYLKLKFVNGCDFKDGVWVPRYENWQCVLGYLLVKEYEEPQAGGGTVKPDSNNSTASKPNSSENKKPGDKKPADNKPSDNKPGNTSGSVSNNEDLSPDGSSGDSIIDDDKVDSNNIENNEGTVEKVPYKVVETREIDWTVTGIIIGADVLVVGAVCAVLIILYKKKVNELTKH